MKMRWVISVGMFALTAVALSDVRAQAPDGPMIPPPGVPVQQGPIKIRTVLVNTPVTVRNEKGEMVNDLEEPDFRIMDNGAIQKITHFNLGGDPISLVVVVETSSRIAPTSHLKTSWRRRAFPFSVQILVGTDSPSDGPFRR